MTLDLSSLEKLGPEPWDEAFTPAYLRMALKPCRQAIKVKLLDQGLVAGVGNIYASEALFRAGISPRRAAGRLKAAEIGSLHQAIRAVLEEAVKFGSTVPLNFSGAGKKDGLFYYGQAEDTPDYYTERLLVYDKAGQPCSRCGASIRRIIQAARSTYFCPKCQR
jgi:formamidopyrimidine-DNA glycosylase